MSASLSRDPMCHDIDEVLSRSSSDDDFDRGCVPCAHDATRLGFPFLASQLTRSQDPLPRPLWAYAVFQHIQDPADFFSIVLVCRTWAEVLRGAAFWSCWWRHRVAEVCMFRRPGAPWLPFCVHMFSSLDRKLQQERERHVFHSKQLIRHLEMGNRFLQCRRFDLADVEFAAAVKEDKGCAMAYSNLSVTHCYRGEVEKALQFADDAVRVDPSFKSGWNNKASILNKLRQYQSAIESVDKSISIDQSNANPYHHKAYALLQLGDAQQAIHFADKAIGFRPEYAEAFLTRAVAKWSIGDDKGAQKDYHRGRSIVLKATPSTCYLLYWRQLDPRYVVPEEDEVEVDEHVDDMHEVD